MKRFRFTLEAVLKVRRGKEEMIQREFSALLRDRTQRLLLLGQLEQNLATLNRDRSAARQKSQKVNLANEAFFEAQRQGQRNLVLGAQLALHQADIALERKRLELVEASRDRAVIEKIEEAQKKAYLAKVHKEEQLFLDELAQHLSASAA